MSPKSEKRDQKIFKKSDFLVFLCGHFIILGTRLGQRGPSMFSNKLNCSQRHHACKVLAQSPEPVPLAGPHSSSLKIDLKALMLFFRTLYKSFVGLEYFRRYCGLKFKHQNFGCIHKFPPPFRVKHLYFLAVLFRCYFT